MNLLEKSLLILEININAEDLIYKYKTEKGRSKDFRDYKKLIGLFKNLTDCNVDLKEILKNQIKFKSDLDEIKKWNPNLKPEDQIIVIQNLEDFFDLREKNIVFLRDYIFFLSEVKYKAKYGKGHQNIKF